MKQIIKSLTIDEIIEKLNSGRDVTLGEDIFRRGQKVPLVKKDSSLKEKTAGKTQEEIKKFLKYLGQNYGISHDNYNLWSRLPTITRYENKRPNTTQATSLITLADITDLKSDNLEERFYDSDEGMFLNQILNEYSISTEQFKKIAQTTTIALNVRETLRKKEQVKGSISNETLIPSTVLYILKEESIDSYEALFHDLNNNYNISSTNTPILEKILEKVDAEVNGCLPANVIKVSLEYTRLINEEEKTPLEAIISISGKAHIKNGKIARKGEYDAYTTEALFNILEENYNSKSTDNNIIKRIPKILNKSIKTYHQKLRDKKPKEMHEKFRYLNESIDESIRYRKNSENNMLKKIILTKVINNYFYDIEKRAAIQVFTNSSGLIEEYKKSKNENKDPIGSVYHFLRGIDKTTKDIILSSFYNSLRKDEKEELKRTYINQAIIISQKDKKGTKPYIDARVVPQLRESIYEILQKYNSLSKEPSLVTL